MKRWIAPLAAVAAFALLLYYVVGLEKPKSPTEEQPQSVSVLTFEAEKADRVEIQGPDRRFSLVKKPEEGFTWWLEPEHLPGNGSRVESLLLVLADLKATPLEAPPPAETVGLERPTWRVDVYRGQGRLARLEVGDRVPVTRLGEEGSYYARANGQAPVFTVSEGLLEQVRGDLASWRERFLSDVPTPKVVRVEVVAADFRLAARREGEQWKRLEPGAGQPEADKVRDLVRKVAFLEAEEFVTDAPTPKQLASWGLDRPWLRAVVATDDEPPLVREVLVGGKVPDQKRYYARLADRPWIYQVDLQAAEDLLKAAKELGS
ncbi:MAG: DUF4340 domain-containing protein [Moorellales bacterium]